jgi:hypothetical protein
MNRAHTRVLHCIGLWVATFGFGALGVFAQADPLNRWHWRNPTLTGLGIREMAYGDGIYIGVGQNEIFRSTNGMDWKWVANRSERIYDVTYGNGAFVLSSIVPGTWDRSVLKSTNGIDWTAHASPGEEAMDYITYGNGMFVAAHYKHIWYSPDAVNWTLALTSTNELICARYLNATFLVVGNRGETWTSTDGVNWVLGYQNNELGAVNGAAYGAGKYIIALYHGDFLVSTDLVTWSHSPAPRTELAGVAFGNGVFLSWFGQSGEQFDTLAISSNGINWLLPSSNESGNFNSSVLMPSLGRMVYGNNQFAIFGGQVPTVGRTNHIATSHDGIVWNAFNLTAPVPVTQVDDAVWVNGLYVAIGRSNISHPILLTSANLTNWNAYQCTNGDWFPLSVAYGNGKFLAVAGSRAFTSPDGTNWASSSLIPQTPISKLVFGNGRFVGLHQTVTQFASTVDGVNWTYTSLGPESDWFKVERIAFGNGRFVAVGDDYFDWPLSLPLKTRVAVSSNGVDWTSQLFTNIGSFGSVVGFGRGMFIATGAGGVYCSTDGFDWKQVSSEYPGGYQGDIVYGNATFVIRSGDQVRQSNPFIDLKFGPGGMLSVCGADGYSYRIEASTDWQNWQTVTHLTLTNGFRSWQDTSTNLPKCFYRAVLDN